MTGALNAIHRGALVLLAAVSLAAPARADTIVLKNRVTHTGAIVSESVQDVTILSEGIQWTFKREQIASVRFDAASAEKELTAQKKRQAKRELAEADAQDREFIERHILKTRPVPASTKPSSTTTTASYNSNSQAQVVVYGTSWCGYCRKAREYFKAHQIPFEDKDVEEDRSAADEMRRKCAESGVHARGVPVIDVNGTMIAGFDVPRIEAALKNGRN